MVYPKVLFHPMFSIKCPITASEQLLSSCAAPLQAKQKLIQPKNSGREALLAWLATAVNRNAVRASKGEHRAVLDPAIFQQGSSDGFSVGLTALCLRFSQWLQKGDLERHLGLLQPSYYAANPFRWELSSCIRSLRRAFCASVGDRERTLPVLHPKP